LNNTDLFTYLGKECGFEGVVKQFHWERALRKKVTDNGTVLLLVSGFEHASRSSQQTTSILLRGLSEEFDWGKIHILVSGGMNLTAHRFAALEHSLMDNADLMLFPDLEVGELIEWATCYPLVLTKDDARELFERYGGHSGLLKQALEFLHSVGSSDQGARMEAIRQEKLKNHWIDQYFFPFLKDAREICEYLSDPDKLGRFSLWPNKVVHRLFWGNLLTKDKEKFRWRSEAIVNAGLKILGCDRGTR
jgi:hypothetical protein